MCMYDPWYLQVTSFVTSLFIRTPVARESDEKCFGPTPIPIPTQNGYISSLVTRESNCGSMKSPWLIQTQPGQKINFTLYDFALHSRQSGGQGNGNTVCLVYANIREEEPSGHSETVCGGRSRVSSTWISSANRVEVRVVGSRPENDGHFLIKYDGQLIHIVESTSMFPIEFKHHTSY